MPDLKEYIYVSAAKIRWFVASLPSQSKSLGADYGIGKQESEETVNLYTKLNRAEDRY